MRKIVLRNRDTFVELTKCWDMIFETNIWKPFVMSFVVYKSLFPNFVILREVKQITILRLFWFELSFQEVKGKKFVSFQSDKVLQK